MKCPICGARISPGSDRCHDCGCHIRTHTVPVQESSSHRERKPTVRLLLAILAMLPVLAIIVFSSLIAFSIRLEAEPAVPQPIPDTIVTVPTDREPSSLPVSDEGCFSISDGELTFLPWCWDGSPIVRVPDTVEGETVISLAPGCFAGCEDLTTIILPDTVRQIGEEAFSGCSALRGLYLPDGTASVDTDAFAGCSSLEALYVPASVQSIAEDCLSDCSGLLYIFYEGTFEDWNKLYSGYITPFTAAICHDGTYYHGTGR